MADDTQQPPAPAPDLNAAIQAIIQQQMAIASGAVPQVQLPSMPATSAQTQYSNDPSKGPDLLERIGLALGGGSLPGAPAEMRAQMGRQGLLNFGIGLMSAGRFATPGEVFAGGLQSARSGLLGSEAATAGQQEYALNAQTKLAELGLTQQKNRTEALNAIVPLLQMQGRFGMQPLFGPGSSAAGPPGAGGSGAATAGDGSYPTDQQPGWSYLAQLSPDMQKMVQAAAAQTGMPVELLAAHKWNESRGQASVPAGDQGKSFGIMQMQQGALDDYNAKHGTKYTTDQLAADPQLALTVGAGHWTDLRQQYGGNNFLASMAYARGPGATDAWLKAGGKYGDLPPGVQRVLGNVYGPGSFPGAAPIPEALALNQRSGQGGGSATATATPPATPPSSAPVGPYRVASRSDVAPPSAPSPAPSGGPPAGQPSTALPEPPQPPAEGIPLPGGSGLRLYPDGRIGQPGQEGRPAITAAQAPGGQTAPPPDAQPTLGPITTAAAPAAAPASAQAQPSAPPAAQPPAQPPAQPTQPASRAPDVTARNDDGTYVVPDEKLSVPQYQSRYRQPPSPDELVSRGLVLPENIKAFQDQQTEVAQAEQDANAARAAANAAQRGMLPGADVDKAIQAATAADKNAQDARTTYNAMVQDAAKTNATALQNFYKDQDTQLSAARKDLLDRQQTVAENQKNRDAELEKARVQQGLNIEQKGAEAGLAESQQTLNDMAKNATDARAVSNQLRLMPGIIDNLPQPGFAAQIAKDHPALIPWMTQAGALSPEQADATQVMRGLVGYMSVGLRPTGSGALRNAEMDRFQAVLPDLMQSANGRKDSLSLLQTLQDRIVQEHDFASKYFRRIDPNTGKPAYNLDGLADAIDAPKSQGGLGPIAPTGPQPVTTDANGQPQRMTPSQVQQWVHDNVGVGHAYWGWQPVGDGTYKQKLMVRRDNG